MSKTWMGSLVSLPPPPNVTPILLAFSKAMRATTTNHTPQTHARAATPSLLHPPGVVPNGMRALEAISPQLKQELLRQHCDYEQRVMYNK